MIAIPNMKKPEYCRVCHERLKCKQYDGEILHTPDDCPLNEIVRCKDCKHNPWDVDQTDYTCIWDDDFADRPQTPDDFCSYGERKEE